MRRLLPSLLLAVTACNPEYPNPFDDPTLTRTVPPPPGSALVFTTDAWSTAPGRGRELMAVAADGSGLTRLTFCDDGDARLCDSAEAAIAADGERAAIRRALDTSGDGRVDHADDASLVYVDFVRQAEAELVPAAVRVSGVDWSPTADLLVYSGQGPGGEDLFRTNVQRPTDDNAQQTLDLSCPGGQGSCDAGLSERRGRINDAATLAVFERTADAGAASEVWVFQTNTAQFRVTTAPGGGAPLAGTPYRVGSDADPDYAPDGSHVVFRHLEDAAGRGVWQIRTANVTGSDLSALTSGAAWRGAPDWGRLGIVFPEADASGTRLVLVQADGSGRRVIAAFPAGARVDSPRWLR
jgi:Tol biopolymer transport system component